MPKIKVYKHRGVMIPLEDAKKSQAYQCKWTGKLYATKRNYVNHLKKLRKERMNQNARIQMRQRLIQDLNRQLDIDSIVNWIETHPDFFLTNSLSRCGYSDYLKNLLGDFYITDVNLDIQYKSKIPNTHCSPRHGITNFSRQSDLPMNYPGWYGRFGFKISHNLPTFGSDLFSGTGIHLGTGGSGGDNKYSYDVKLFQDDWEGLKSTHVYNTLVSS